MVQLYHISIQSSKNSANLGVDIYSVPLVTATNILFSHNIIQINECE
jgi:hypothetical protein